MSDPNPHVSARVTPEDYDRIERVCELYELDKSKLVRLCIHHGLDTIQEDGLDALAKAQLKK